jgi:hypothetical protein
LDGIGKAVDKRRLASLLVVSNPQRNYHYAAPSAMPSMARSVLGRPDRRRFRLLAPCHTRF